MFQNRAEFYLLLCIPFCLFLGLSAEVNPVIPPVDSERGVVSHMDDGFMVMDGAESPTVAPCGPNVNCAFQIYNQYNIVDSHSISPCGQCVEGYDCLYAYEDWSMCMYIYQCQPSESNSTDVTTEATTRRKREQKVYKLPSPKMLEEGRSGRRTGKTFDHCRS